MLVIYYQHRLNGKFLIYSVIRQFYLLLSELLLDEIFERLTQNWHEFVSGSAELVFFQLV